MAETTEIKEERNALGQVLKEPTTELHNSLGGYYIPYFKIPQVRFTHTKKRAKNKDITAMKYKIDKNGFHGEGCTNQLFDITRKGFQCERNQNSIVKIIPDEFNKETFDEKDLASSEGRYYSLGFYNNNNIKSIVGPSNVYLTGPMGEFEEFDEKELIIGDYDKEFQLVYQGKTFEVDGLVCVKADIELNGKDIIPGPTDHIYEITSTNDRLLSMSTLISPFAEDDNCVRVVVLPCQSEGMILQPGDVLGTLKIVKPEDFDRVKEVYVYTSNILANLWMKENTPPKFLDKLQFQELIKEWQENKLKNNEEVRKKREALSLKKKKNIAEMERARQEALQRKAEKKAEHDRVIKEGQEISAKKKQAKREAAKQKQAEDMRRKQDKIKVEQRLQNPVFGKPLEFGKPSGPPSTSHKPVCKHYLEGKCEWGARCKYYHPEEENTSSHGSKQNKKRSYKSGSDSFEAKLPRVERADSWVNSPASRGSGFSGGRSGYSNRGHGLSDIRGGFSDRGHGLSDIGHGHSDLGHGLSNRGHGLSDKRGGFSDRGHGLSGRGLSLSDRGHGLSDRRDGFSDRGHGLSDRGHGLSDRGHGLSDIRGGFSERDGGYSNRVRGFSDRDSGSSGFSSIGTRREDKNEFFNPPSMMQQLSYSRFEGNSGIQFEEHRSISQIPVVGSSDTSFGNRTFMGGAIVPATGAGNSHVKDIEMERLEVQMRKKKLMEDILNSQKELLKLETAEGELLKRKSDLF